LNYKQIKEVLDMATTLVQVRIDDELKNQATAVYDALGIDLSTAVRMFLKRSVMVNGVPFNMTLPKGDDKARRAARALQELSKAAVENGTSEMTLEEINAEIDAVRNV
jgi:DNA-damage-inducible protein J